MTNPTPVATSGHFDVAVLGGGLAGLTLARQLLLQRPETRVLILEKRTFPVVESAYKVGESTVEIGAHYLAQVVGLKKHLIDDQLPKFGLRFFFPQGRMSLADAAEVGSSEFFAAPGYQVDRGRLENYLAKAVVAMGAVMARARVRDVQLAADADADAADASADARHRITYELDGQTQQSTARWIVDASGRASYLKRRLKLEADVSHNVNAVWFRIGAQLQVDDWSDDPQWRARIGKVPRRWLSTNHLLGRGYWVWIIPLPTGATSIGVVADPRLHPLSSLNRLDRVTTWLEQHEPLLASKIAPHRDKIQDFLAAKRLARASRQIFSSNRWALTGEAAVFLDPLYSPGIDYIAIGNTMICKLLQHDLEGSSIDELAPRLESTFLLLFQNNLLTYEDQYPLFGNPRVMSLKYVWDYAVYWSFPALLYFNGKIADPAFLQSIGKDIQEMRTMNQRMQAFFRQWDADDPAASTPPLFVDQHDIQLLTQLNAELQQKLDDQALRGRIARNVELLRDILGEIIGRVRQVRPQLAPPWEHVVSQRRLDGIFEILRI